MTGRLEVTAVLQPVNLFLNPADRHLKAYFSQPTNTHTLSTLWPINLKICWPLNLINKLCLFFSSLSSFFLHPATSVMSLHSLPTPPSQGRTAGSSLGIRGSGAQVSPAATLTEPSLPSPSNEQAQVSALSWFSKETLPYRHLFMQIKLTESELSSGIALFKDS